MDGHRFDALTRQLTTSRSRRTLLRGVAGGALAALGLGGLTQARCPREQPITCDGTCVDLRTDPANCGRCGTVCPSGVCYAGRCLDTCPNGLAVCGGSCYRACPGNQVLDETCACACPAGSELCRGLCRTLSSDAVNCGTCGHNCATLPRVAAAHCAAGVCVIDACDEGYADCDGASANGCETPLGTDANCGACGHACAADRGCIEGTCVCVGGATECTGVCVDTSRDVTNCGACGNDCTNLPNVAAASCEAGACVIAACEDGFADFNGMAGDGCETELGTDANCGACGERCGSQETCVEGACACVEGTTACNGVCTDTSSDVANCGACGAACGSGEVCRAGDCVELSEVCATTLEAGGCVFRQLDRIWVCDSVNLAGADLADCDLSGAILVGATLTNATLTNADLSGAVLTNADLSGATLTNAGLRLATLLNAGLSGADLTNADLWVANLANVNLSDAILTKADLSGANLSDANLSGATLHQASLLDTSWSNTTCPTGANSNNHDNTCCGQLLAGDVPAAGCVCPGGTRPCGGACVDLRTDPSNCGACGLACPAEWVCVNAVCRCMEGTTECAEACCGSNETCIDGTCVCAERTTECAGVCTDTSRDESNCGACGNVCGVVGGSRTICCDGACVSRGEPEHCGSCDNVCPSWADTCVLHSFPDRNEWVCVCGSVFNQCVDGQICCGQVCVDPLTDRTNCGSCGSVCRIIGPGGLLLDGQCCNGVCTDTLTDPNNCGACGNACNGPLQTGNCIAGGCQVQACPAGRANCDGDPASGCEVDLMSDPNNCGACGHVCPCQPSGICNNGTCCIATGRLCEGCSALDCCNQSICLHPIFHNTHC